MKQIAEKCPKGWARYKQRLYYLYGEKNLLKVKGINSVENNISALEQMPFNWHFGILVLDFFPEYDIHIAGDTLHGYWTLWRTDKGIKFLDDEKCKTPEKVIERAFEILEKKLEKK